MTHVTRSLLSFSNQFQNFPTIILAQGTIFIKEKSSRRERLTPVLSHHRTYGSVYGGSIKIIDASLYITSVNSCSLYASGHSTLQEVPHGIHRFLPQVGTTFSVFIMTH